MNITSHAFTNNDAEYHLLKQLLLEIEKHPEIDNNWDLGRMDFWRYNAHADKELDFFQKHVHYWKTDTNQVVALFVSEYGKDDFFIVIHPNFWTLFPQVLDWGLQVWAKGKTKISTDIYTFGQQKIQLLTDAGFYEDGHVENVRIYPLDNYDCSYQLKSGFKLMSCAEYGNVQSRVELVRNAFDNPHFSEARLHSIQSSPNYRPELDLVIVNSENESVAYCMGWIQEDDPKLGYIEPMGTHSEYRKNGFGKSLAKECFKRLAGLGVETAWVASHAEPNISNFLYDSLKPTKIKRSYRYSWDLKK